MGDDELEKQVINDLVILGKAAPDSLKDGRKTICVGGWSPTKGFIRIYPAHVYSPIKRWNVVQVPVERNPQDTRPESWKIQGSKREWSELYKKIKVVRTLSNKEQRDLIREIPKISCIEDLNEEKKSLGIIQPKEILEVGFKEREKFTTTVQTQLFDEMMPIKTKENYPLIPYIKWVCPSCKNKRGYHEMQVLEWGAYEWFRKNFNNRDKWEQVWENMHLFDDQYDKWFFVGNQAKYRKSFLIISVLRFKKMDLNKDNPEPKTTLDQFF